MTRRELLAVGGLFAALTLVLAYPLSVHAADRVLPLAGDTRLMLWSLAWDVHALTARPWALFDANIFHPERLTLAFSENSFGSALMAAPILWTSGNTVLAMNAVVLIACVLCGVGAYMLARELGLTRAGAIIAGIIFAFAPPRFLRLGQLHLATVQWVPFCLVFVHRYLNGGRARDARIAAGLFTLQALTSGHGGVFAMVAIACVAASRAARREPLRLARLPGDLGRAGAVCLVLLLLFTVPYVIVERQLRVDNLARTMDEARYWSPDLASFLASPSAVHEFVLARLPFRPAGERKAFLFPGILPLVLAAAGIWATLRRGERRATLGVYVAIVGVSLWLALGPDFGLYALAFKLPVSSAVRVPSRYITLTVLGLAVLAGAGFDHVSRRAGRAVCTALAALVALLMLGEFSVIPLGAVPFRVEIPAADRWLATRPKPFIVAEVPVVAPRDKGPAESRQSFYMLHSMAHWQKTVHGYSGFEPPRHTRLYTELVGFPDETTLQSLERFGVNYIVVHQTYYPEAAWEPVRERLASYRSRLRLVYADNEARVYEMRKSS